ncbi:hypothetical protein BSSX_p0081 (plasmid) [Bacillus subtilis]|nr:hypothetical protein BSSX_p0081 [Bacillus subtilis]
MLSGILEGSEMPQGVSRLAGLRLRADPKGDPERNKTTYFQLNCISTKNKQILLPG